MPKWILFKLSSPLLCLLLLSWNVCSSKARAEFLGIPESFPSEKNLQVSDSFLAPNERQIRETIPFLERAPENAIVAGVGTERMLMLGALQERTHRAQGKSGKVRILALDSDPGAIVYLHLVRDMLKAVPEGDRAAYLKLRTTGDKNEWNQIIDSSPRLTSEAKARLKEHFDWWSLYVRHRSTSEIGHPSFREFHAHPIFERESSPFAQANYLYDDELFRIAQKIALEGRLEIQQVDLAKESPKWKEIVRAIEHHGLKIGVLDLSNAWWNRPHYLGPDGTLDLARRVEALTKPNSILLLSSTTKPVVNPFQFVPIRYFGYTFRSLNPKQPESVSYQRVLHTLNLPTSARLGPSKELSSLFGSLDGVALPQPPHPLKLRLPQSFHEWKLWCGWTLGLLD